MINRTIDGVSTIICENDDDDFIYATMQKYTGPGVDISKFNEETLELLKVTQMLLRCYIKIEPNFFSIDRKAWDKWKEENK